MSRGAPRGRGRGRGGGPGGRDPHHPAFAGMSIEDKNQVIESFSKPVKGSGMLYPPVDKAAELDGPVPLEERIIAHAIALNRDISDGPTGTDGQRIGAPWRLASERKVVGIEIESYSDRYRRPAPVTGPAGSTVLDIATLKLSQELFPPALWTEYFDGQASRVNDEERMSKVRERKRKRVLDGGDNEDDGKEDEEKKSDGSGDDEDDFDFDDEEEEDHQDYDHNYFDNGEDDDDSGGDDGGDDGGRYDD